MIDIRAAEIDDTAPPLRDGEPRRGHAKGKRDGDRLTTHGPLMRRTDVATVVRRSISGHLTEKMQDAYSTAEQEQQRGVFARWFANRVQARQGQK